MRAFTCPSVPSCGHGMYYSDAPPGDFQGSPGPGGCPVDPSECPWDPWGIPGIPGMLQGSQGSLADPQGITWGYLGPPGHSHGIRR